VHGRWSYLRIARMVAFFFYKNLLFGLTIFFYNILCSFSGQILFDGARPLACLMQRSFHSTHMHPGSSACCWDVRCVDWCVQAHVWYFLKDHI